MPCSLHGCISWPSRPCSTCRCLEPPGRLASELLPYARALSACVGGPALQRLLPARWTRFWNGQLFDEQPGGGGGAQADEAAAGEQQPGDDAIEESADEW